MSGKIVHIVHWKNSGIYAVAHELAAEGAKQGHAHLIRVIRRDKSFYDVVASIFRIFLIIVEVFFSRKNLYHAHSFLPFLLLYFSFGAKAITFHNLYPYFSSKSRKDAIKRFLIAHLINKKSVKASSVGIGVAGAVREYMSISSTVIFNGLHFDDYKFLVPEKKIVLGAAGRLDDQKNFENLIVAFAHNQHYELQLNIAGEGVKRPRLEALIKEHGLADRVKLLGHQSDMSVFYQSIDVFVCCSLYEGFGLVIAEAVCSGKPVISTNVGIALDFPNVHFIRTDVDADSLCSAIDAWKNLPLDVIGNDVLHNRSIITNAFSITNIYQQYVDHLWTGLTLHGRQ